MTTKPTGHVEVRHLKAGDAYYAKLKLPDGTQPRRRLGRVWTKRSQPPPGYLNRAQAEARLAEILAGNGPVNVAPTHITFEQACDEQLRYLEHEKQRKPSTLTDYRNVIDHDLKPYFGASTPIESIGTLDIESFKDVLLARVSHRTAQKVLVILHGIFGRAKRKGWIERNPAIDAEKVTVRRSDDFNVLSPAQISCVASAARTGPLRGIILTAAFTGLRQGELLALRWQHVDFANRILHVQRNYVDGEDGTPKSHHRRSVPLSDQAIVALDTLSRREHFTEPDDLVFCNEVGGYWDDSQLRRRFYAALEAAELGHLREQDDPITFHDLRHTFGTLCASAGIELTRIKAWMGHADIQTTMRYLHHVPAHDDADRMTAAFSGKRGTDPGTEFREPPPSACN